jgi:hypothetical protein
MLIFDHFRDRLGYYLAALGKKFEHLKYKKNCNTRDPVLYSFCNESIFTLELQYIIRYWASILNQLIFIGN